MASRTAAAFLLLASLAAAQSRFFQPADLNSWHTLSDPRISPDGQWLAYLDESGGRTSLRLVPLDGKPPIAVAAENGNDRSPRWSFDSLRLVWLTERAPASSGGRAAHITVRRMDTGAETIIAALPMDPIAIAPAPEGEALAFNARVSPQTVPPAWIPPELLPRLVHPPGPIALFLLTTSSAAPRRLSAGDFDYGEPAWTTDGRAILAARAGGPIYAFPLSGGEHALYGQPGLNQDPLPSPDGRIAWLATDPQPPGYAVRKLWVMNADGSRVKILTGSLDRDVADPQWSSDGRTLYFLADDHGATRAYAARNDGTIRQLPLEAQRMAGFSVADNGVSVTVRSTVMAANEIVSFAVTGPPEQRILAAPNRELLAARLAGSVEELTFSSAGQTVQAWLTRPPGFNPAQKYALLVDLRDDPHAMCGGEFNLRAQIFAAREFAVLCVNTRGTPGFGEEFGNLLATRFPGDDADDVLRGIDQALAKGFLDPRRVSVTGGVLAAWLIGHTGRFAAAILRHPIADWTLEAALDRNPARRTAAWMNALPWENPDQYVKHSPIYFAGDFKTPTLVIEQGDDPQARELYFALQSRKVESALLRLPDAASPTGRMEELEAELAWLAR